MTFEFPKDPNILLSIINMKLRDAYDSLEILCEDMDIDYDLLQMTLQDAGYEYIASVNQFHQK
ncbi:DUF4250 domain-containing protein [Fusibacter tunisiensis]|uniref:DUF4250 domain-containing protein n=1 Tax=Fusibacter tunisiensis TaxID=1008308 RepID=A0ABS2MNR1_9FIRM|nr:DUF4250 domain-containing protein [Fusibacter tunisiensis]MBM7561044.1 hypothetical protein [Fusibacter tunisiensis]